MTKLLPAAGLIIMLSGCASAPETLPVSRSLAHPTVHPITAPAVFNYPALKEPFIWPVNGTVSASYGSTMDRIINKGMDISAREGTPVRASRSGRVVYCDSYFKGFGKTLIIDHGDGYQTVYAYNSDILVKVGDKVSQNDVVAKVGRSGRAKAPMLHFEIRRDGEPQNPFYYLRH